MLKLNGVLSAWKLTPKQRNTLLKILINASNAVLGGAVLGNVLGQGFRMKTFVVGFGMYAALVAAALRVDR